MEKHAYSRCDFGCPIFPLRSAKETRIVARLLIIFIIGFVFSAGFIWHFIPKSSVRLDARQAQKDSQLFAVDTVVLPAQQEANFGLPMHLQIPKIKVEATIEQTGLTFDGAMDVPKSPADVAWFKLGARPGEKGSAVIAGHYGTWKNGQGSVFDTLYTLKKGDLVYVKDDKGVATTFVVRTIRSYDPKADASDVFGSSDGKSHLNLITCEGIWNPYFKSYSQRLIVFADKV